MNRFEQRNSYGGSHGLMDSIDTNTGETAAYETPEQSEDSANTGACHSGGEKSRYFSLTIRNTEE